MRFVAIALLPLSLLNLWQRATQATNSHAANVRGVKAYEARQYPESANAFSVAKAADPSPANAFNLGTSQIAAGQREQGSASLTEAMRDRTLRAAALYNRGNSALAANAFDNAIRDYAEALRFRPADAQAKRNLEIALAKKQQEKQSREGQQKNPSGSHPNPQQPQSGMQKRQPNGGEQNAEALLRAVQEQEQEELNRMKRARADRQRVGW